MISVDINSQGSTLGVGRVEPLFEIKSKGLIGERYVDISPGKATDQLQPGGHIRDTESPVDIQEIITKFIFGNVESTKDSSEEIQ